MIATGNQTAPIPSMDRTPNTNSSVPVTSWNGPGRSTAAAFETTPLTGVEFSGKSPSKIVEGDSPASPGGYVDFEWANQGAISVDGRSPGAYLSSRLAPVHEAYQETIQRTDAEFACWNRHSDQGLATVEETEVHSYRMTCEFLEPASLMDVVEHVLEVRQQDRELTATSPILIHVADYQEAIELERRLSAFGVATHLASPFSNWTSVLGKLGTGQVEVIVSTTMEIPHVEQVTWKAIYLPSTIHLAMLTTPELDWLGNYWFANNLDEQPPRLIVRRQR